MCSNNAPFKLDEVAPLVTQPPFKIHILSIIYLNLTQIPGTNKDFKLNLEMGVNMQIKFKVQFPGTFYIETL